MADGENKMVVIPDDCKMAMAPGSDMVNWGGDLVFDESKFAVVDRVAAIMASGKCTVPKHLQGNAGDCFAIALQALRWKMDPFAVAQKTHIVNGALGYEAQLVNAVAHASGAVKGHFDYQFSGEGVALRCRVGAVLSGDAEYTYGEWLCVADVKTKNSPLWATNPRQQLAYLQVKNWVRLYAPAALLGVYTDDELIDVTPGVDEPQPRYTAPRTTEEAVKTVDALARVTSEQQLLIFNAARARKLTNEETAFIIFNLTGAQKSSDILSADLDRIIASINAAAHGRVMPDAE